MDIASGLTRRTRPADTPETPERIIAAARTLFHQRGYADVGINELCQAANVAKGSFYHFYPSKQALLEAVIRNNADNIQQTLSQRLRDATSGREAIVAHFEDVVGAARSEHLAKSVLGCALGTLASELAASNEDAQKESGRALMRWQHALATAVRAGVNDGSIAQTVDPDATALALLACIQGMSTLGRVSNDPDRLQTIAQTTLKRLLPAPAISR